MKRRASRTTALLRNWLILSSILTVCLTTGGFLYYGIEKRRILIEKYRDIESIINLETKEIERWRIERLADARELANSPLIGASVRQWVRNPNDERLKTLLERQLRLERRLTLYSGAFVVDTNGQTVIGRGVGLPRINNSEMSAFNEVLSSGTPAIGDFFRTSGGNVCIDAFDAVRNRHGRSVAVIVLRTAASNFLFPLIDTWPIATKSARSILAERLGNNVRIICGPGSDGRATVMKSFSLMDTNLVEVKAALGYAGKFEGEGLKGQQILAYLRPIPETPWFFVGQMDLSEILAEANFRGGMVGLIVLLTVGLAVFGTAYAYRREEAAIYRELLSVKGEHRKDTEKMERLGTIVKFSDDAILGGTLDGIITSWNVGAERIYGYSEYEAVGKSIGFLSAPGREGEASRILTDIRNGKPIRRYETIRKRKDGTIIDVSLTVSPIINAENTAEGFSSVSRDITDLKRAENDLARFFDLVPDLVAIVGSGGYFKKLNPAWQRILGYTLDELYSEPITSLINPADVERTLEEIQRQLDGFPTLNFINRYRCKDGAYRVLEWQAAPSPDGENRYLAGRDITERQEAEKVLRLQSSALQSASSAIVITNRAGEINYVNSAFTRLTGYTGEEVLGRNLRILKSGKQPESFYANMWSTITAGAVWQGQLVNRRKDGTHYMEEQTITPVRAEAGGGITHFIAIKTDVTERIEAERKLRESVSQLHELSERIEKVREDERKALSHEVHDELGQILTAVRMSIVKLNDYRNKPGTKFENEMMKAISSVDDAIKSVRDIAGRLRPGVLDLLGLIPAIEWQVDQFRQQYGISCSLRVPKEEKKVDDERATVLFRILQEGLTNIARHARAGNVAVTFSAGEHDYKMVISDDGIGITEEQANSPHSFGLMGIKERLRPLGGNFMIRRRPEGGGTEIRVDLPKSIH